MSRQINRPFGLVHFNFLIICLYHFYLCMGRWFFFLVLWILLHLLLTHTLDSFKQVTIPSTWTNGNKVIFLETNHPTYSLLWESLPLNCKLFVKTHKYDWFLKSIQSVTTHRIILQNAANSIQATWNQKWVRGRMTLSRKLTDEFFYHSYQGFSK